MPYKTCKHLKMDGRLCQSPALASRAWCYFHAPLHGVPRKRCFARPSPPDTVLLPPLDTAESVRSAIALVVAAIASGKLDNVRAGHLLSALHLAVRIF